MDQRKKKKTTLKRRAERFPEVIIPKFIFTDGSVGVFAGFNRGCCPDDGIDKKHISKMGLFDKEGNYFYIEIDTRKKRNRKHVTYIYDGKPYRQTITKFYTVDCKVNPSNGHLLPHENCPECFSSSPMNAGTGKDRILH